MIYSRYIDEVLKVQYHPSNESMYDCGPTSKQTAGKQARGHGRSCHARDLPIKFSVNARAFGVKPVTDEQVFYDKFLCDKFYLPSARVHMQQILYDKLSYDKLYLLV